MSVSRKKQPILLISFEIDKPYKPTMTIYDDSDVDLLIRDFIKTHQLKSTAYNIVKRVVDQNLQELREEQRQERKKSSKEANKENQRLTEEKSQEKKYNKSQMKDVSSSKQMKERLPRPPQIKPSETQIESVMEKQSKLKQAGLTELEEEFQRQFREVKTSRFLSNCQPQLLKLYDRLTYRNPPGCHYIDPDYIDFSSFQVNLLDYLEQFFSLLDEEDFQQLDYEKFRKLLKKHQCLKLVQFLADSRT